VNAILGSPNVLDQRGSIETILTRLTGPAADSGAALSGAALEYAEKLRGDFAALPVAARFEIVHSLVGYRTVSARGLLASVLLEDPSPLVRHEAAFVIGCVGGTEEQPFAREALKKDPSFLVRHEAAMALAEIGDMGDVPFLVECASDENEEVRISCEFAISHIRARELHGQGFEHA
jgi:hypothetical protein